MHTRDRRSRLLTTSLAAAVACSLPSVDAAGDGGRRALCAAAAAEHAAPPYVAVLSAFPAELAPLVAAAEIERTVEVDARQYYVGRMGGVSVVLGLTGIGIVNATSRARSVLASFPLAGLVMSGVAGSRYRIGDVILAAEFAERDRKRAFRANPALLALAARAASALPAPLETCTPVPPTAPDAQVVCLPYAPAVIFAGRGVSGDNFGGKDLPCARSPTAPATHSATAASPRSSSTTTGSPRGTRPTSRAPPSRSWAGSRATDRRAAPAACSPGAAGGAPPSAFRATHRPRRSARGCAGSASGGPPGSSCRRRPAPHPDRRIRASRPRRNGRSSAGSCPADAPAASAGSPARSARAGAGWCRPRTTPRLWRARASPCRAAGCRRRLSCTRARCRCGPPRARWRGRWSKGSPPRARP